MKENAAGGCEPTTIAQAQWSPALAKGGYMWVGSDVGYNGHRNGVYEKPVSVISRWICDTKTTHDERFFYCLVICLLRNKPGSFKQTEYSESLKNNHLLYIFCCTSFAKMV